MELSSPEAVRAHGGRVTHAVWRGGADDRREALCGFVPAQWWEWKDEHVAADATTVTCTVCRLYVSGGAE